MTKQEFETLINKEVTYETFRLYESMYNALPESINKQQFIEMLNLKSIPENPEAIRRREENQKIVKEIKQQIKELQEEYEEENSETERFLYPIYSKKRRQEIRSKIRELKALLRQNKGDKQ